MAITCASATLDDPPRSLRLGASGALEAHSPTKMSSQFFSASVRIRSGVFCWSSRDVGSSGNGARAERARSF